MKKKHQITSTEQDNNDNGLERIHPGARIVLQYNDELHNGEYNDERYDGEYNVEQYNDELYNGHLFFTVCL